MLFNRTSDSTLLLLAAATLLSFVQTTVATDNANWPDWRGPTGDGQSEATGLPLHWSETQNIVWKTAIHDLGYSTPVVWGDQVWLTTATKKGTTLYAVCVDLNSGRIVHDVEVFHPEKPQRIHRNNSYATPSAVIEEGFVYVHYGTHGTACIDTETGKVVWRRDDLNCDHMQGPVSSPILYENLLVVPLEGVDVQFVVALDKKTGKIVWRYDRPRDLYDGVEPLYLLKSYHTPVIVEIDGTPQLINNGAMLVTGHEPRTGKELWRVRYRDDNPISRIISGRGFLFINAGGNPGGSHLLAVRQGGVGDVTDTHVVWTMTRNAPHESSPVLVGDLLYLMSDKGLLTCKQATTGKTVWTERLEGDYGASLLHAEGRIYMSNKKGKTTVIEPGPAFRVLAVNQLDGFLGASPAVAGKSLLMRSKTHLYRIQNPKPQAVKEKRWSRVQAWKWYRDQPWPCGFNYIPARAISYTEMWMPYCFDLPSIDKELALAQAAGFNCLRVVLPFVVWEHDPEAFIERLASFLSVCDRHGIKVMFTLFDDCAFGSDERLKNPTYGRQPDVLEGWYANGWTPSPGHNMVRDSKTWPRLEKYVKGVISAFKDDRRVWVWDLYNEPTNGGLGNTSIPLAEEVFRWAREVNPSQPLTIGQWNGNEELNRPIFANSDIITFHNYGNAENLSSHIDALKKHDRPMINTEWLNRGRGSVVETCLPVFAREKVGCMHWGLVNGKTQTDLPWGHRPGDPEPRIWQHDLYHQDHRVYNQSELDLFSKTIREMEK